MLFFRYLVLAVCFCSVGLSASAHRVGLPVTTIEWNPRSQMWEITHRIDAHDFNPMMYETTRPSTLYTTPQGQAAIGNYVRNHFSISGDLMTEYIGAEMEGDFVWIYTEMQAADQTIEIRDSLLMDKSEDATALVNVKDKAGVTSLVFTAGEHSKAVELKRPS